MEENKLDKRVRRTKRLVREALLSLMVTKPVEKITTTELCAAADINRNTFYAHYSSPEDVLAEIEAAFLADLSTLIEQSYGLNNLTLGVCQNIAQHQDTWRAVWRGCPRMIQKAVDLFCEQNLARWLEEGLDSSDEGALFLRFAAQGTFGIIETWLEDGCQQTPEELSALIDRFVYHGRAGVIQR